MRRAGCCVLSLLLGLVLCRVAVGATDETVAVGEITGKVLMPDGSPAAGAHVRVIGFLIADRLTLTYAVRWTLETTTGEDGSFQLQPEPIAREGLSWDRPLLLSIFVTHEKAGFTGTMVPRRIDDLGKPTDVASLKLNEPATLTGTVTDAAGRSVAQATVTLMSWSGEQDRQHLEMLPDMSPLHVATQADGTFAFERVPKEGRFTLLVQKDGYPDGLVMSAPNPVIVALPKPGSLAGRVVSAAGEPVAGCHVSFAAPPNQQPGQTGPWVMAKAVATGPDGRFTVPMLFPAAYDLRVEPPASAQDKWAPGVVTNQAVAAGETKDVGDIVLTAGGVLAGKVTDTKTGKPLADARVSVMAAEARSMVTRWSGKTDADGRYELRLPAGTYQVYAFVSGYASPQDFGQRPALSVATGGRAESNFELHPVFAVKGRLLLPDGSPAANCSIRGTTPSNPYVFARSEASGRFTLERVAPGEQVDLSASDPEHGARLAASFTVSEDTAELTFTMEKAATCLVTGRVVDDEGKPVSGMQVAVVETAGNAGYYTGSGTTGPDGRFAIKALQGGEGYISLGEGGGGITDDLKLRLDSEHVDKGDLVAPRLDQQVAGIVVDMDGEPVPGAHVQANGVTMRVYAQAQTGSDGRFRLEKLPKDTIRIEAFLVDPESRTVRNEVGGQVPAGSMDVRLVMGLKQKADVRAAPKAGEQAPELVLEQGAGAKLAEFRGKPVVLAFVSIYSRPCVKALDELKALQEKQGADKLGVTAVHDRTATPEEIERFRKDHSIPFAIVCVPDAPREGWDSDTFRAYGVTALPTVVLVDAEGNVVSTGDAKNLEQELPKLPLGATPRPSQGRPQTAPRSLQPEALTFDDIAAGIMASRSSLRSMRVRYEVSYRGRNWGLMEGEDGRKVSRDQCAGNHELAVDNISSDSLWHQEKLRWYLRCPLPWNGPEAEEVRAFDGRNQWWLCQPGSGRPSGTVSAKVDLSSFSWNSRIFDIASLVYHDTWEHALKTGTLVLARTEAVDDDHQCYVLEGRVCVLPDAGFAGYPVKVWIDPARGFAIVRLEAYSGTNGELDTFNSYDVLEMKKGAPNLWVPVHVLFRHGKEIVVKHITVNERLPDDLFTIKFPHGTKVQDDRRDRSYTAADVPTPAEPRQKAKLGGPAPELLLEKGAGVTLAKFKGKPVVLVFVSIYSRLCVKVLDDLKALQEKQGADKLGVIAVHDRTATLEEIEQFRKEQSIPFPIVRVPDAPRDGWDSATFRAYGITALPTVIRIDTEGKVESVGAGLL